MAFTFGEYVTTEPLVIDPTLIYSTYLGGSGADWGYDIAVDGPGNAYITGGTWSNDFPTKDPLQSDHGGSCDVFVAKLNASGSGLVYSTYLGGSSTDLGKSIAVDSLGNAYITGGTCSNDFSTKNPLQPDYGGGCDAFVAKLDPSGSALIYSTYLGGSDGDEGHNIAVDTLGNAYIIGRTFSADFPSQNPLQPDYGGGYSDVFVAKLNASGSGLVYSTYLGGSGKDLGESIAVDSLRNAYITGLSESADFPTQGPLQPDYGGGYSDVFVAKLNASGSGLVYSTYLGGSGEDWGSDIAVDSLGNAYITGWSKSADFPTQGPLQPDYGGGCDAFVAKLNASGFGLVYSTFLGGTGGDSGRGIAVDSLGNVYITGGTYSADFPTKNPLQPDYGGGRDAFVAKLNASGSGLVYSTFLGDSGGDLGLGIAADGSGNASITGWSESTDFPTKNPLQPDYGGGRDAFVAKIGEGGTVTGGVTDASTGEGIAGATVEAEGPIIGPLSIREVVSPAQAGAPYSTTTDANGDYTLYLPEGAYGMMASAEGYELGLGGVTVAAGETAEVNFSLTPLAPENHPPIARALDINGQPPTMYPDTVYSVIAKYYDPDGRADLKHCYLRLNHPTKPLTMMWYQSDGHSAPWAGEEGENYLTITDVDVTEIANASEGYELTWSFQINDQWPEVENAIDFGVFAWDDSDLISDWDYDDTNASFFLAFFNPILAIPVCGPTRLDVHIGTTVMFVLTVRNGGNKIDSIHLSTTYDADWNISLSEELVTNLPPGETRTVSLSVPVLEERLNSIDITAISVNDPTESSRCTVKAGGYSGEGFFLVKATFSNETPDTHQLYFEVPDYVKISEHLLLFGHSIPIYTYVIFDPKYVDPKERQNQPNSFELVINDLTTGEQITIQIDFNTDEIIATNFDMTTDSYSFLNFGPGWFKNCFGMSDTSILYFEGSLNLPEGITTTYELTKEQAQARIIIFQYRWLHNLLGAGVHLPWVDVSEQYRQLEESIGAGHPMILAIPQHAVVAYKIVIRDLLSYIFIYDSETPLIENASGSDPDLFPYAFPYAVYDQTNKTFRYGDATKFLALKALPTLGNIISIGLECPVHLRVTDQYGRSVSDEDVSEIPGAGLWRDETDELTVVYLPVGLDYQMSLNAYEKGTFTLRVFFPVSYDTIYAYTYEEVSVEVETICSADFAGPPLAPEMSIDLDGDGRVDAAIPPLVEVLCFDSSQTPVTPVPPTGLVISGPHPIPPQGCIFWLNLPDDTVSATLKIFDIDGALLVSIPLDPTTDHYPIAGRWIPEDDQGRLLGTGLYLYLVEIEHTDGTVTYSPVQKMVIRR